MSSRTLAVFFNITIFPFVTYSRKVLSGLQHPISVEILSGRMQQSPLFPTEVDVHIILGHCTLVRLGFRVFGRPSPAWHCSIDPLSSVPLVNGSPVAGETGPSALPYEKQQIHSLFLRTPWAAHFFSLCPISSL